jgi:hypothetical protein
MNSDVGVNNPTKVLSNPMPPAKWKTNEVKTIKTPNNKWW